MDNKKIKKQYPKSISGKQCVGPCYHPNVSYVHPLYLTPIKVINDPTCPTSRFADPTDGSIHVLDTCSNPTHKKNSNQDVAMMSISPYIPIDDELFLKYYYEIYTMEDAISAINNNYWPRKTGNRVINMALKAYGQEITIIDHRIVDFIRNHLVHNMAYVKKVVGKYINVDEKNVKLKKPKKKDVSDVSDDTDGTDTDEYKSNSDIHYEEELKSKYIKKIFLNRDEVYKFSTKYLKQRKDEWGDIDNHLLEILKSMSVYIESKIKKTLGN